MSYVYPNPLQPWESTKHLKDDTPGGNCCENWIPYPKVLGTNRDDDDVAYRDKQCIAEKYADSYWIGIKVDVHFGKLSPYQTSLVLFTHANPVAWVYLFLPKIRRNQKHEPPTSIGWKFINMKRIFNMKSLNRSPTQNHQNIWRKKNQLATSMGWGSIFTYMFSIKIISIHIPGDSIRWHVCFPWQLEVINNLQKGHVFTIPKWARRIARTKNDIPGNYQMIGITLSSY